MSYEMGIPLLSLLLFAVIRTQWVREVARFEESVKEVLMKVTPSQQAGPSLPPRAWL